MAEFSLPKNSKIIKGKSFSYKGKSENKKEFNDLMTKSSDDMIKLTSLIEDSDDIRATLTQMMWSNCKACHSKFRAPH